MPQHKFEIHSGDYTSSITGEDPFKALVKHWKKEPPNVPLGMLVSMKRDSKDETGEDTWFVSTTVVLSKAGYDVSRITKELGKILEEKHKQKAIVN